jgi:hypothetical protein
MHSPKKMVSITFSSECPPSNVEQREDSSPLLADRLSAAEQTGKCFTEGAIIPYAAPQDNPAPFCQSILDNCMRARHWSCVYRDQQRGFWCQLLNKARQGTSAELLCRVRPPFRLHDQFTALITDYKVRDFARSSSLSENLDPWKQAINCISHGAVVGLGGVLRDGSDAL